MSESTPRQPDKNSPHLAYIKDEFFIPIESGEKTLELRIGFGSFSKINEGDILKFKTSRKSIKVKVNAVREYKTLEGVMGKEDINKIVPGISKEGFIDGSKKFFKQSDIDLKGLVVLEFEKI
jgi:ASC-1-like (ASCH) protein